MDKRKIRILLIEDDEDDYVLARTYLAEIKQWQYVLEWAKSYKQGLALAKKQKHDVFLVDYHLGEHNGLDLIHQLRREGYKTPMILLTGLGGEQADIRALKMGASDYLAKGEITSASLERAIRYALERKQAEEEREKLMQTKIAKQEAEAIAVILESITDAVIRLDENWQYVYVNSKAAKLLHKPKEKLIGKAIWDVFPGSVDSPFYKKCFEVRKKQKPAYIEYYSSTLRMWVQANLYPSKEGVTVYFADISGRKKAEEALRESEERFRMLADTAPVMIWMSGTDKQLNYFNKIWLDFTGRTIEEEIGKGWINGIHPDDVNYCITTYEQHFDGRKPFKMEYRLRRYDGKYHWVLDTGLPRFSLQGEFLGFIGSAIDITQRKELEQRKNEFISIASHELKTPMTTIKAFTQLLERHFDKVQDKQALLYLMRINTHINKLTDLISDLLDISRIESGRLFFQKDQFALDTLIYEVVADMQYTTNRHTIISKDIPNVQIYGDRERIGQVLANLIANAIKYSPDAGKIIISSEYTDNAIIIKVQDFGIGIPLENKNEIFERFYRVSGPDRKEFAGLGLGLYISSQIIKRHKGKIWVESQINQGSTFYIQLPLEK